jgi:hypothetical protein
MKHGGEGGEGGEGGGQAESDPFADASPDAAFTGRLLLIKGHLRVGKELHDLGRVDDALPHYLHPVEEIYEDIEPDLTARGIAPFKTSLEQLAAAVKAKKPKEETAKLQERVIAALDTAMRKVDGKMRAAPSFVAEVAVLALTAAAEEYAEAVENGRIANGVEYQDSRGFVLIAQDYLAAHAEALRAKDSDAYGDMMAAVEAMREAYPSVLPPATPKMQAGEVEAAASRVELLASRFR